MCMITIFREGKYKLVSKSEDRTLYAILKQAKDYDWCWIQIGKWYRSRGLAEKKLKQLSTKRIEYESKRFVKRVKKPTTRNGN